MSVLLNDDGDTAGNLEDTQRALREIRERLEAVGRSAQTAPAFALVQIAQQTLGDDHHLDDDNDLYYGLRFYDACGPYEGTTGVGLLMNAAESAGWAAYRHYNDDDQADDFLDEAFERLGTPRHAPTPDAEDGADPGGAAPVAASPAVRPLTA